MPTLDFHGQSVEEAIRVVEKLIDNARLDRVTYNCTFITGNGIIKQKLIELLKGCGFRVWEQINNTGIIKTEVE